MTQMKDSGVEWIGNVPNNWSVERLHLRISEINEKNNPIKTINVLSLTNKLGVVPYEEKGAQGNVAKEDFSQYKIAYPNTIVANSMNVLIGSVGICDYFGCVSPIYYIFKPGDGTNLEFINYIFQTVAFQKELRKYANGILEIRLRVSADNILKQKVALPQQNEQRDIVSFLNDKNSEIKSIIDNLNKQIESLKDYKKEIISEAVTKGLDPNVPLKDSGVEWLGSVPESWEIVKGKFVFKLLNRPTRDTDDVITCFRDGEVTLRSKRREEGFTMADFEYGYQGIEKGDLVVHGMDGFAGAVGISDSRGKGSPVLNVLDTNNDKRYMMYYFRGLAYRNVFVGLSTGIRVRSCDLHWKKIGNLCFLVPPISEQNHISEYLDEKCEQINQLIIVKQRTIDKLNEYSKSLIYEYVTGKKEVSVHGADEG